MTPEEWAEKVRALSRSIANKRVAFLAATGTMVVMSDRIWGRGELTDGSKMTYKDGRELYAYTPPSPRKVTGKGKPDKDGKTKRIKGGYYVNYTAYKTQQGRADNPFELTGSLRQSWLGGAGPTPTEVTPLEVVITLDPVNMDKAEGLAKLKGEFLGLSDEEVKGHHERVARIYRSEVLGQ